jgi:hypothetical protein
VLLTAIPENYADFTSSGIMKNNPAIAGFSGEVGGTSSIELRDAKWLMDTWMSTRIDPLETSLHEWLCRNKGSFGRYDKPCGDCNGEAGTSTRQTGYIFGIYDEGEECCDSLYRPAPPAAGLETHRKQFVTQPGDTSYTSAELMGAVLVSLSLEGYTLSIGFEEGEMLGLDPATGKITWNDPAPNALRGVIIYKK